MSRLRPNSPRSSRAVLRAQQAGAAFVRRLLLRAARKAPAPGANPQRVVILLSSAWGMGGTIRAALNLAGWLAPQGREVEIITTYRRRDVPFFGEFPPGVKVTPLDDQRPGHQPKGLHGLAYRVLRRIPSSLIPSADRLYPDFSLYCDLRLVRKLRGEGGIVIGTRPAWNLLLARMRLPGAVSVGQEQMHLGHHNKTLRTAMKRLYRNLDAFVVLTQQDGDAYRKLVGRKLPLYVIPNTAAALGGPDPDPDTKLVVAAGRFRAQKGFDYLIEAWRPVAERHPDWTLRIHGDGKLRPRFEAMVREYGLEDVVELPGPATDMGAAMAQASIFALSSRFEGFPLILLEAMSKGLAPVSFDCPTGPADIIDNRRNGIVVPPRDPGALAQGLLEMIGDDELRRRCAAAARETAAAYSMEAVGPKWDEFLAGLRPAA